MNSYAVAVGLFWLMADIEEIKRRLKTHKGM